MNPDIEIETPPAIQIVEGSANEQTAALSRDILLVVATLPALIAVVGKHDVNALVSYIASAEFGPALGVLVASGVVIWRQLLTRRAKKVLVTVGKSADNSVAQVIQK